MAKLQSGGTLAGTPPEKGEVFQPFQLIDIHDAAEP
jgi:hypothetical protein